MTGEKMFYLWNHDKQPCPFFVKKKTLSIRNWEVIAGLERTKGEIVLPATASATDK